MNAGAQVFVLVVCLLALTADQTAAVPIRVKRVSDQRLAELETLLALSKMSGKLVTVPLGFGKIDPTKIGRRRRSEAMLLDRLLNQSVEDMDTSRESLEYA